jgi:hypothetical protein
MSPSTTPALSETGKPQETREPTTHYLESEKDKHTSASSTVYGETEKQALPEGSGTATATQEVAVVAESAPQDSGDHATGVKLLFIVIALILSIFLFSLDQVSLTAPTFSRGRVLPI